MGFDSLSPLRHPAYAAGWPIDGAANILKEENEKTLYHHFLCHWLPARYRLSNENNGSGGGDRR